MNYKETQFKLEFTYPNGEEAFDSGPIYQIAATILYINVNYGINKFTISIDE